MATLPMRSRSPTFCVTICRPWLERSAYTCGQRIWRRAIFLRSNGALSAMAAQKMPPTYTERDEAVIASTKSHCLYYILYVYFGKGGEGGAVREKVEGQQYTRGVENTNYDDCISCL
jgi:hypothetical protein